jgi:hypothetical protein
MTDLLKLILGVLASLVRSRARLEAENLVLRQQINVLRRRMPKRPHLNYATLLRERSGRRSPLKELHANGVTISVVSLDGNHATVKIDSGFAKREPQNPARSVLGPNTCKAGYVWREADESDWVCVSMTTRTQVQNDNARATRGPCEAGLVSREAFPGDRVCVTAAVRAQTIKDNMNASNRVIVR